jgi:cell division protein FtsN
MSRDYKHRAQARRAKSAAPGWLGLAVAYLLGAASVGLVWLKWAADPTAGSWIGAEPQSAAERRGEAGREAVVPPKPRFDFYTLLPSMEVVVPDEELEPEPVAVPGAPAASAPPPDETPTRYLLQVASFRKAVDADRLKAQLALLGYEASVQQARATGGGTWHRVRIGPFDGTRPLQQARERLARDGHKGIVIRVGP